MTFLVYLSQIVTTEENTNNTEYIQGGQKTDKFLARI